MTAPQSLIAKAIGLRDMKNRGESARTEASRNLMTFDNLGQTRKYTSSSLNAADSRPPDESTSK